MYNRKKTGEFIASCRKEKGLTQRQLADILSVNTKIVNKWEIGYCFPDTTILPVLCTSLNIKINELLSGERMSSERYYNGAEKNMMSLMIEKETERSVCFWGKLFTIIGTAACLFALIRCYVL